jgi:ferric-dicitrate binding protein FerR (iron transport regulator)
MPTRFDILLQGYLAGSLTPPEVEEFLQLVRDRDVRLPDAVLHLLETAEHPPLPAGKEAELADAVLLKARRTERHRRPAYWLAAAAVLTIAGATLLYLLQPHLPASTLQTAAVKNTVQPGYDQATLLLGDGTAVPLDSAGNQQIRRNIRQSNGQLHYTAVAGNNAPQLNTLVTPKGGRFGITLPDGSKVWLNSASSLRYPTTFTGQQRVVQLKGQGYFEVAQAPSRPFVVKVNGMEVQVLGTRFDVMAYEDEKVVNTTLLSGAVRVRNETAARLLHPGQQAVIEEGSAHIAVQEADTAKAISWKNGLFLFDNMDLETILREVSRWYNVEIVYSVKPSTELYGGAISRGMSLEAVLHMLEGNGFNHLKLEGRKITVMP